MYLCVLVCQLASFILCFSITAPTVHTYLSTWENLNSYIWQRIWRHIAITECCFTIFNENKTDWTHNCRALVLVKGQSQWNFRNLSKELKETRADAIIQIHHHPPTHPPHNFSRRRKGIFYHIQATVSWPRYQNSKVLRFPRLPEVPKVQKVYSGSGSSKELKKIELDS